MSRCTQCSLSFEEDNGWQEFCSTACAKEHFTSGKKGAALIKANADFATWLADPKNARLVRLDGAKAEPPKIGTMVKKTFVYTHMEGKGKDRHEVTETVTRMVNEGGLIQLRPITDEERRIARSWRGRGSFGENHVRNTMTDYVPGEHGFMRVGEAWFPHDE